MKPGDGDEDVAQHRLLPAHDGPARPQAQAVADAAHKAGIAESFGDIAHTPRGIQRRRRRGRRRPGPVRVPVLDMASAYATLAASGIYRQPHFVTKVETNDGTVPSTAPDPGKRVFAAKVADNVTAALGPIAGYPNGNSLYDPTYGYRRPAAKTGTAQLGDTGQQKGRLDGRVHPAAVGGSLGRHRQGHRAEELVGRPGVLAQVPAHADSGRRRWTARSRSRSAVP